MVAESNAGRVELLEVVEIWRHECESKSLFEAWQFCGGHQQVVNQMATSHETWQKLLVISSNIAIYERRIFIKKCYQEPLASFIEVRHLKCFDASIIRRDRVGEYGLGGNI